MKKSYQIASAFVGLVVGAGFTSGQEIMQFFTSFGWTSLLGALCATFLFALLGMQVAKLGADLQATSHKEVIYKLASFHVGFIIDFFISIFLFGITVVMFAGSGAMFQQMFGIEPFIGQIFMVLITIFTLMLNVQSILNVIGAVTPYLFVLVLLIAFHSIFTMESSFTEQHQLAKLLPSATTHWFLSCMLYVSYNLAAGVSMLAMLGGTAQNRKVAGFGGFLGGVLLGVLILLMNLAMLTKIEVVAGKAMPMLALASEVHPVVGVIMSILLLAMMYNTAVGMFYTFAVRMITPNKRFFKLFVIFVGIIGFAMSFIGFTTLVAKLYSIMGYLGFFLIFIMLRFIWKRRKMKRIML